MKKDVEIIPDGLIVTHGGFMHAAHEFESICGWGADRDKSRNFPVLDITDADDVRIVNEWVDRTRFGWYGTPARICSMCLRKIQAEPAGSASSGTEEQP